MEEQKPVKWKIVEPNVWRPENDGDFIEGVLINKNGNVGANLSNTYYVENRDGAFMVWGSTVLDNLMSVVKIGERVKITYKGLVQNARGQDTKIFKVEREEKEE